MTTPIKKAEFGGELQANPELRSKFVNSLLRLAALTAMGGGAARAGMSVVRNMDRGYDPPAPVKPLVVDLPYATSRPVRRPIPPPDTARMVGTKVANTPDALSWLPFGIGDKLYDAFPTVRVPGGNPGETDPHSVPLYGALAVPAGIGGALGGYKLTDSVLRAADRRRAQAELEEAKKEYEAAVAKRMQDTLTKRAAAALDGAAELLVRAVSAPQPMRKAAEGDLKPSPDDQGTKTLLSLAFPGLILGRDAALGNMAVVGMMGGLGGYAGYQMSRDDDTAERIRRTIKKVDSDAAKEIPRPMVGRLIPTYVGAQ